MGGTTKSTVKKLEVLQKKALRIIANAPYNAHTTPICANLGIMKMQDIYELQLARFIYSLYNNQVPKPLKTFFSLNSDIHQYNTRNRNNPVLRLHKTNVAARSIYTRSYKLWYDMESDIKCSTSLKTFTKKYKRNILHKYTG